MNKIGSVKVVDGFTFTLVEKEKFVYMVEITREDDVTFSELKTVAHNTWKSGRFTKILRELNPQPKKVKEKKERTPREPQPKLIDGVLFRIVERNKETKRVTVVAEGFEGTHEMSLGTWYRGRFYKNAMKHLRRLVDKVVEKAVEMGLVPLDKVVSHKLEETAKDLYDLKEVRYRKDLKKVYKKLARRYHPDNLETGNEELFKKIVNEYERRDEGLRWLEDTCAVEGFTLEESVEMYEGIYDTCREIYGY